MGKRSSSCAKRIRLASGCAVVSALLIGTPVTAADVAARGPHGDSNAVQHQTTGANQAPAEQSKPKSKSKAKPKPKPRPALTAYKPLYYDNDFGYLRKPGNKEIRFGDDWKQLGVGAHNVLDLGGEYRLRHHHEAHLRGSDLSGRSDDFLLQRTRLYANWRHGDWLRVFAEAVDATSAGERFAPRTIEENRFDALNLFGDLLLWQEGDQSLTGRAGRQELLYGAQRLISPLDWANTRRTFDGARGLWKTKDWSVDAFWTRPVPFDQHVNNDHNFDHPDRSQELMGIYATHAENPDQILDYYYLRHVEHDAPRTRLIPVNFDTHLLGTRWYRKVESWMYEVEGGYQFGSYGGQSQSAGFLVLGMGHAWTEPTCKPTLWCYYDWAAGDVNPNDRTHGTFQQLFPLGHKYFGFMDLVARQNIRDLNFLGTAQATKHVQALLWWHIFNLDRSRDALYNALGAPIRRDPTGAAGRQVGQEIDFLLTYAMSPRSDLQIGYSQFFAGDFVRATNPIGVSGNANFCYTQASFRF